MKTFDESQMKRIASAVKLVERSAKGTQTRRRRHVTGSVSESGVALIQILNACSGGGKYYGIILEPSSASVDVSTDFEAEDIVSNFENDALHLDRRDCVVINTVEQSKSTHDLDYSLTRDGSDHLIYLPKIVLGYDTGLSTDDSDALPVYVIVAFQWFDAR